MGHVGSWGQESPAIRFDFGYEVGEGLAKTLMVWFDAKEVSH